MNLPTKSADCNGYSLSHKVGFASETVTTEAHAPDAETEIVLKDSGEKMASCMQAPAPKTTVCQKCLNLCMGSVRSFIQKVSEPVL